MGNGSKSYFLEELNLSENNFDDDAARQIIEAAVRDRCSKPSTVLWLDMSANCIKQPKKLFQKMEA